MAAVSSFCQTASGGSYFAFVGGVYQPAQTGALSLRVAVSEGEQGLGPEEASLVHAEMAREVTSWPRRPEGEIVVAQGLIHLVDSKAWAWKAVARALSLLLAPDASSRADDDLVASVDEALRYRP